MTNGIRSPKTALCGAQSLWHITSCLPGATIRQRASGSGTIAPEQLGRGDQRCVVFMHPGRHRLWPTDMHLTGNERQHLAALLVCTEGRRGGVESDALEMPE
jgi:hypothetical protein